MPPIGSRQRKTAALSALGGPATFALRRGGTTRTASCDSQGHTLRYFLEEKARPARRASSHSTPPLPLPECSPCRSRRGSGRREPEGSWPRVRSRLHGSRSHHPCTEAISVVHVRWPKLRIAPRPTSGEGARSRSRRSTTAAAAAVDRPLSIHFFEIYLVVGAQVRGVRLDKFLGRDVPDVAAPGHGEWKRTRAGEEKPEKGAQANAAAAEEKKK